MVFNKNLLLIARIRQHAHEWCSSKDHHVLVKASKSYQNSFTIEYLFTKLAMNPANGNYTTIINPANFQGNDQ